MRGKKSHWNREMIFFEFSNWLPAEMKFHEPNADWERSSRTIDCSTVNLIRHQNIESTDFDWNKLYERARKVGVRPESLVEILVSQMME